VAIRSFHPWLLCSPRLRPDGDDGSTSGDCHRAFLWLALNVVLLATYTVLGTTGLRCACRWPWPWLERDDSRSRRGDVAIAPAAAERGGLKLDRILAAALRRADELRR